jgi:hypothetical protein
MKCCQWRVRVNELSSIGWVNNSFPSNQWKSDPHYLTFPLEASSGEDGRVNPDGRVVERVRTIRVKLVGAAGLWWEYGWSDHSKRFQPVTVSIPQWPQGGEATGIALALSPDQIYQEFQWTILERTIRFMGQLFWCNVIILARELAKEKPCNLSHY